MNAKKMAKFVARAMLVAALSALTFTACGDDDDSSSDPAANEETESSIAAIVVANEDFETLEAAVGAAELVETLDTGGPFTVFAPTDAAFDALPEGTVEALLNDQEALTNILLYHVVDGAVGSSEVVGLSSVTMLNGSDVAVTVEDGRVWINESEVVTTDIQASNGVIHVIDVVLLPPN